ncbi:hypothetical protein PIB30_098388 [Stylosanthes scabra]|uniref:Uncharacterized protein n=1 Tax=Stylosanthes scabra TaxID=79078 RepID=A0ABU6WUR0_9FABA|nr:hypothetical protein [Stylosanthes scabra]
MRQATKRTEAQISHLTDLLTKLTNQVIPSTSTPPPPPNPSPLPSQPLPNPKGGINMVKKGDEEKEERRARTEWLLELMAKVDGLVDPDDEDWWDESNEEDEEDPHSKGGTPQVLLGRPTLKTVGFKLDYITETFSFKVGNVEEIYHPERPPASNKKFAHQVQLSSEDKVKEKEKKDPMKKKVKIRNQEKESSKEESKEEKGKRRIELKYNSAEELIGKLLTFKRVLHNNDAMSNHLVKDQSKWK